MNTTINPNIGIGEFRLGLRFDEITALLDNYTLSVKGS
jgi:hypothetical protein